MVALEYSDSKILRRAARLRGRLPYRGLVLLLPLYAVMAVLLGWHWSAYQLDHALAGKRQQAEAMAIATAAPLEGRIADLERAAAALAAQPEIVAALSAVNMFRQHSDGQSVDHVACDAGENAALTATLRQAALETGIDAIAVLDGFGDCQAASPAASSRQLFGPRSNAAQSTDDCAVHAVREGGKSRLLGLAVTAVSRDVTGRVLGSVALFLDRARINALLPMRDPLAGKRTAVAFDGAELRGAQSWNRAVKRAETALLKLSLRGVPGYDIVSANGGWELHAIHRIEGGMTAHASLPVDPLMQRLLQFGLVILAALAFPAIYLLIVLTSLRTAAATRQGLPTA